MGEELSDKTKVAIQVLLLVIAGVLGFAGAGFAVSSLSNKVSDATADVGVMTQKIETAKGELDTFGKDVVDLQKRASNVENMIKAVEAGNVPKAVELLKAVESMSNATELVNAVVQAQEHLDRITLELEALNVSLTGSPWYVCNDYEPKELKLLDVDEGWKIVPYIQYPKATTPAPMILPLKIESKEDVFMVLYLYKVQYRDQNEGVTFVRQFSGYGISPTGVYDLKGVYDRKGVKVSEGVQVGEGAITSDASEPITCSGTAIITQQTPGTYNLELLDYVKLNGPSGIGLTHTRTFIGQRTFAVVKLR